MWIVYVTDERSSRIGGPEKQFDTEDKALDNFIKRLRAFNALKKNKLNLL